MSVHTFPQRRPPGNRTDQILDMVRSSSNPAELKAKMMAKGVTRSEYEVAKRRLNEELAASGPELAAFERLEELVAPVFATHGVGTIGEALRVLADQGNEEAAAWLAASKPDQVVDDILNRAVAADPYWSKEADGTLRVQPGARYRTPEELMAAWVEHHPEDKERLVRAELERQIRAESGRRGLTIVDDGGAA